MAERTSSSPSSDNAFATVVDLLLDFMVSKSLVASERTLRNEFQMLLETANNGSSRSSGDQRSGTSAARAQWNKVTTMHNQYTSELERRLELLVPRRTEADDGSGAASIIDRTPKTAACVPTCEDDASSEPSRPLVGAPAARIPALFDLKPVVSAEEERRLRQRRGVGTPQQRVVFHDPPPMPEPMASSLAFISLPLLYNPNVNGLEDQSELHLPVGALVAGRCVREGARARGARARGREGARARGRVRGRARVRARARARGRVRECEGACENARAHARGRERARP